MARQPVKAAGRLIAYGSTRYQATGATKGQRRANVVKGSLVTHGAAIAGQSVGAAVGMAGGSMSHAKMGAQIGGLAGELGGRKIARHYGMIQRNKPRIAMRAATKHGIIKHNGPIANW